MSLTVNFFTHSHELTEVYQQVRTGDPTKEWAIFGYDKGTNDLKVLETGVGLEELSEEFSDGKIQYAFVRVIEPTSGLPKLVLIGWCGSGVPVEKKGLFASHLTDVASFLKGYHLQINARTEADVEPSFIMKRINESTGAKYTSLRELATERPAQSKITSTGTYTPVTALVSAGSVRSTPPATRNVPQTPPRPQPATATSPKKTITEDQVSAEHFAREEELRRQEARREQERQELEKKEQELREARFQRNRSDVDRREAEIQSRIKRQDEERKEQERRETEMQSRRDRQAKEQAEQEEREKELRAQREQIKLSSANEQTSQREAELAKQQKEREDKKRQEREEQTRKEAELRAKKAREEAEKREEAERTRLAQERAVKEEASKREAEEKIRREEQEKSKALAEEQRKQEEAAAAEKARQQNEKEAVEKARQQKEKEAAEKASAMADYNAARNELHYQTGAPTTNGTSATTNSSTEQRAVALYDYEAMEADEMPLTEGETVIITDRVDADWWIGTGDGGKSGLFPASYVKLLTEVADISPTPIPVAPSLPPRGKTAKAQYDYDGVENDELSFKEGDLIINITTESDDWWRGMAPDGKQGLFPATYVTLNST
ncbi:hypothetical protein BDF19DRAFT_441326 [Syncephalis fuscata]|nr:hypothetical protein BDF19DRAFT_441326 [Syncephalis fuscata]